jgi:hypothetical protein
VRDGKEQTVEVTLGDRPTDTGTAEQSQSEPSQPEQPMLPPGFGQ